MKISISLKIATIYRYNRPRCFSVFVVLGIYIFDIPGEKRTTESTTNIFQKISIIDSQVNEKVYFQDEQPVDTSTIKVPFDNGFLSKDIVNSEPLSTIKERGMYPKSLYVYKLGDSGFF
jgi:hypothetical protein